MDTSGQEKEDRRTSSGMGDSNAMTIEFLRARLLSERSISRSARQRADELAKRVDELEEQLRIVSLQRKKAEKATADVLAILKNNGITDISEAFDSSSEENDCESKVGNKSTEVEGSYINSKVGRNDSEECSGSDHDSSPLPGRSLSWKGCKNAPNSSNKYKGSLMRRRSSYASAGSSSSKQRQGKSCRRIRHRESRSVVEDLTTDSIKVNDQGNKVAISSEVFLGTIDQQPNILKAGSERHEWKNLLEGPNSSGLGNGGKTSKNELNFHSYAAEKDMERAVEYQEQLIERYEAMERVQQEWEEKFRENNDSTPDSGDHGNHSDVTDERDEIKSQAPYDSGTVASQVQEARSKVEGRCFSTEQFKYQSNGLLRPLHDAMGSLNDKNSAESAVKDSAFPVAEGKQNQESLKSNHCMPSDCSYNNLHLDVPQGIQTDIVFSANRDASSSSYREASGSQNDLFARETSSGFDGVLDALKKAKLSLQQKMGTIPSAEAGLVLKPTEHSMPIEVDVGKFPLLEAGSFGKEIIPSVPARRIGGNIEIPGGCARLFRIPTLSDDATKDNYVGSGSQLDMANHFPDAGVARTASDQLFISSYLHTLPSFHGGDRLLSGAQFSRQTYKDTRSSISTIPSSDVPSVSTMDHRQFTIKAESGSRISTEKPNFDNFLSSSLPPGSQYTHPSFRTHPDLSSRLLSEQEFPTFRSSQSVGIPPGNHFAFYNDHLRPDMYR